MNRITQQTIKHLVTDEPADRIIWDSELRGFGVRITETGVIRYILDYRFRGKKRRYTIGRHPEYTTTAARDEAMALRVDIQNGHDPLEERDQWKSEPGFRALAESYIKAAETRKRESSLYDDRRMLKKIILPAIGDRRLGEIKQSEIARLHESLSTTPYQGNRVLALLSAVFNYGIAQKWNSENPCRGIPKFAEAKRERWLSVEEIQRFREALDQYPHQDAANALRLLLLTGSRASEVLKAGWDEFDLARGVWIKPSHHTKQKKQEHVPLSGPAIKLLESMAYENATGPLFPSKDGKGQRVSLKRPWVQACKAAGLVEKYSVPGKRKLLTRYRPIVRVHDLRHNFASHLVSNGVSLQVVGKLLGHTQAATTMRYSHLQDAPLRSAADQVARIFAQQPKSKKRRAQQ